MGIKRFCFSRVFLLGLSSEQGMALGSVPCVSLEDHPAHAYEQKGTTNRLPKGQSWEENPVLRAHSIVS